MPDAVSEYGYLGIEKKSDETYIGGIIISDIYGIPVEFKYTEPVRPTNLQKILYGKSIEKYLTVDILAKKLLMSIQEKPRFILVKDMSLLQTQSKFPVIFIESIKKETNEASENDDRYRTDMIGKEYKIVYVNTLTSEEYQWLTSISKEIDIIEPFSRLKEALDFVCSEK
jgi:hypothetical protein